MKLNSGLEPSFGRARAAQHTQHVQHSNLIPTKSFFAILRDESDRRYFVKCMFQVQIVSATAGRTEQEENSRRVL